MDPGCSSDLMADGKEGKEKEADRSRGRPAVMADYSAHDSTQTPKCGTGGAGALEGGSRAAPWIRPPVIVARRRRAAAALPRSDPTALACVHAMSNLAYVDLTSMSSQLSQRTTMSVARSID